MNKHGAINYVELPARNIPATKKFFEEAFNWTFVDYGSDYTSFKGKSLEGGFYDSILSSTTESGGCLLVFYSENLEETLEQVEKAGGKILKPIFDFPGGRRFQFTEPSGNEFGVWSE